MNTILKYIFLNYYHYDYLKKCMYVIYNIVKSRIGRSRRLPMGRTGQDGIFLLEA